MQFATFSFLQQLSNLFYFLFFIVLNFLFLNCLFLTFFIPRNLFLTKELTSSKATDRFPNYARFAITKMSLKLNLNFNHCRISLYVHSLRPLSHHHQAFLDVVSFKLAEDICRLILSQFTLFKMNN